MYLVICAHELLNHAHELIHNAFTQSNTYFQHVSLGASYLSSTPLAIFYKSDVFYNSSGLQMAGNLVNIYDK